MPETRSTLVESHMVDALKDHKLTSYHVSKRIWPEASVENPLLRAFWMRRPHDHLQPSYYSVLIIFSPIGIMMGGDIRFGQLDGIKSNAGYDEDWFAGKLDEPYLAEKFGLDWSKRPPKSHKAEMMQCACGWLAAVQQRFRILRGELAEEYHKEVHAG